jgi:Concanavalin A-like lectin/glucanases superfamily
MATQYGFGKMVTDGLVLALNAADKNSYPGVGSTWFDVSGNNNHITLTNGPTFSSTNGGCIAFDGVDDFGTINSNTSLTMSQPTLLVVCTGGGFNSTVLAKGGNGSYWNYGLRVRGSTTNFYARNNNSDTISPTFSSTNSAFSVYGMVWNGSTVKFFRNGIYGGDNNSTYSPVANNSLFLRIGCAWNQLTSTNVEFFQGEIASIYIYNRALSDNEMISNQNNLKSRFGL